MRAERSLTLYTVTDAAPLVGVSRSTLYRLIRAGDVPHRLMRQGIRMTGADIAKAREILDQPLAVHQPAVA